MVAVELDAGHRPVRRLCKRVADVAGGFDVVAIDPHDDLKNGMPDNPIIAESIRLYQQEVDMTLK